jgi:hypothetical protein
VTLPIHVISVSRNAGAFTREHLESLLSQDYGNFHITWLDDCSDPPDRAVGIAIELLTDPRHRIVQRTHREGGLYNAYHLEMLTPPGEIIFAIGGDDHLTRPDALSIIAKRYADPECWFTHGASWFIGPNGNAGTFSAPALHDDFRTHPFFWLPCSWRSELTYKIDPQDLQIGGWWIQAGGDVALYTPILEMCGLSRLRYIEDVIYFYRAHDTNEGKLSTRYQEFCGWMARTKPKYSRLRSLDDKPTRTEHVMPFGVAFTPQLDHGTPVRCRIRGDEVMLGPV